MKTIKTKKKKTKTYYVSIERQCQTECIVKVKAKSEREAENKALKVYLGSYDIYVDTDKPQADDTLILDEDGEEISLYDED